MMSTLHTCLDIIAQCINAKTSQLPTYKISFHKWLLNSIDIVKDDDLRNKIIMLSELEETKYLCGYVNINKHRNIIKIEEQWFFLSFDMPASELWVGEFTYSDQVYREKPLRIVMNFAHSIIQTQIYEILERIKILWLEDSSSN